MSPAKIVAASPTTTKRLPLNAADFRFRAGAGGATSAGPEVQLSVSPASLGDWRTGTELGPAGLSALVAFMMNAKGLSLGRFGITRGDRARRITKDPGSPTPTEAPSAKMIQ